MNMNERGNMGILWLIAMALMVVGFVVGAGVTWIFAPEVGGEYWPYIHVIVSLFGGIIVAKVLGFVGGSVLMIFM